ncbi:MAG: SDR family oxidoreductase [Chloroflexi bacterium]|nr:SDR family oxidoreductase [Chloroflexota bacterium]
MQLDGRVALITGAGRNIGRAIALGLARDGASVIVNARSNRAEAEAVAEAIRDAGGRASVMLADVGDRAALQAMLDAALAEHGRIDIVVNNAATRPSRGFLDMTYEGWRAVLATDLDAAFIASRAAAPGMVERGWGRIINLSGLSAFQGGHEGVHISAAKVGIIGLTRALSAELAPAGVLTNCIVPGLIDTRDGDLPPCLQARLAGIPVGRQGTVEDIAAMCTFLCSDAAGFVTGQTIHVNGGERAY